MPVFHPSSIKGKAVGRRPMRGGAAFLLGNTLGGLQEVDGVDSALAGSGLGMGMYGMSGGMFRASDSMSRVSGNGMSSINKKLESLMVKASKPKPKNIKFSM